MGCHEGGCHGLDGLDYLLVGWCSVAEYGEVEHCYSEYYGVFPHPCESERGGVNVCLGNQGEIIEGIVDDVGADD